MPDYKSMYLSLFNTVTDVIRTLQDAQVKCEDIYIESSEHDNAVELLDRVLRENTDKQG